MDLGISGKTAIVTGASAGIGLAIAEEFAQNGMRVVIVARDAEHLRATAKQIAGQFKAEVLPVAANVADPAGEELLSRRSSAVCCRRSAGLPGRLEPLPGRPSV